MRVKSILQIAIQLLNCVKVKLLFVRTVENLPRKVVNVPCLVNSNVWKFEGYRADMFRQGRDKEV